MFFLKRIMFLISHIKQRHTLQCAFAMLTIYGEGTGGQSASGWRERTSVDGAVQSIGPAKDPVTQFQLTVTTNVGRQRVQPVQVQEPTPTVGEPGGVPPVQFQGLHAPYTV